MCAKAHNSVLKFCSQGMPEAIVIDLAVVFVCICVSVFTPHAVCVFCFQLEDTDSSPDVPVEIEDNTATSQVHCFFVIFLYPPNLNLARQLEGWDFKSEFSWIYLENLPSKSFKPISE